MITDPLLRTNAPSHRRVVRTSAQPPLRVSSFGASDRGREREINEDRFLTATIAPAANVPAHWGHILAVADGVGGSNGGERASELAIATIQERLVPPLTRLCAAGAMDGALVLGEMRACFRRADARIRAEAAEDPGLYGMATTLTIAVCFGRRLLVAHTGDSRCYVLRAGALRRLTNDHTVTADLVRRGLLTPEVASEHNFRHVLTEYVGGGVARLNVDVQDLELWAGDRLLLCSDGLSEMVPSHEIGAILLAWPEPEVAAGALVERANELGGRDNVTAVVAHCEAAV